MSTPSFSRFIWNSTPEMVLTQGDWEYRVFHANHKYVVLAEAGINADLEFLGAYETLQEAVQTILSAQ